MKDLLIIGAGGHGRVVADIALALGRYEKIAFLDDRPVPDGFPYPQVGTAREAERFARQYDMAVAIGEPQTRGALLERLEQAGANLPALVHPGASIGSRVLFGDGTVVMAGAVVNCDCDIGRGCIINTGATVDHDNILGDLVHICPGAHLAGTVRVGTRTWIGVGSVVKNNCAITADCVIGAGAVVCRDLTEPGTYVGVPARRVH